MPLARTFTQQLLGACEPPKPVFSRRGRISLARTQIVRVTCVQAIKKNRLSDACAPRGTLSLKRFFYIP